MDLTELTSWVTKRLVALAKDEPAYIALGPRDGNAYPQRGRLNLADLSDVPGALRDEVADIVRGADAEDKTVTRVKVLIYGPKGSKELASQVFRIAPGSDEAAGGSSSGARDGEVTGCLREMRQAVTALVETNVRMCAGSNQLAVAAIQALQAQVVVNAETHKELAETKAALIVAEETSKTPMQEFRELLEPILPMLPMLVARLSAPPSLPPS